MTMVVPGSYNCFLSPWSGVHTLMVFQLATRQKRMATGAAQAGWPVGFFKVTTSNQCVYSADDGNSPLNFNHLWGQNALVACFRCPEVMYESVVQLSPVQFGKC